MPASHADKCSLLPKVFQLSVVAQAVRKLIELLPIGGVGIPDDRERSCPPIRLSSHAKSPVTRGSSERNADGHVVHGIPGTDSLALSGSRWQDVGACPDEPGSTAGGERPGQAGRDQAGHRVSTEQLKVVKLSPSVR